MVLTYYDMEKLSRMVYDQKVAASLEKIEVRRSRIRGRVPPHKRVPCRIRPSGAAA